MAAVAPMLSHTNSQMQQYGSQGSQEVVSKPIETDSLATLLIQHLPEAIPHDTLSRLFSHYGAVSVRPCNGGRLRNSAFVDFRNEVLASQARRHLNGLRFLGKVLSVEKASQPTVDCSAAEVQKGKGSALPKSLFKDDFRTGDREGVKKRAMLAQEPIAERLGVEYLFPPHLEYAYPPPDGNILTNIVNSLIAVPRFYVQVLHLMNKMNLPAPFRMALPTPPLAPSVPNLPPPPPIASEPCTADLSSEESELGTSSEEVDEDGYAIGAPELAKHGRKRIKRESIIGPGVDRGVALEAVGLKAATLTPKEIPLIKKKNPVLQIKISHKEIQNVYKDDDSIVKDLGEPIQESKDLTPYATPEELKAGKLPPEEILSLPMFKNYTTGDPASVLYIKNLAKDVVTDDFLFIFGSLFGSIDAAKSGLNVKLMQEGRMRGQAFVAFPSVDLASHALNIVNGYVFKGKPMIIQFGRNPGATKGT